jgi:phage terminase small subunit
MDQERKQKINNKKYFDKKYKRSFVDDEKFLKKEQQKIFKQKKRQIIDQDTLEDMDYFDTNET